MRCQRAACAMLLLIGIVFWAAGCTTEAPTEPSGQKTATHKDVTVAVSGMT